jgi:hypothetical protein
VFRRELQLPCDLLFGTPPDKERPTIDYEANLVNHLHDIHSYAHQHLKLASDQMKTRDSRLANSAGHQEGDREWLYNPTHMKGKSLKPQSSWEGLYKVVIKIKDVVYRIQWNRISRMMVVHLEQLAPYQGTARDK